MLRQQGVQSRGGDRVGILYSSDGGAKWSVMGNRDLAGMSVVAVEAREPSFLVLSFTNGERRCFDVSPYLDEGVFQELRNPGYFQSVRAVSGFVEWPRGQDFCLDTLYPKSVPIALC